MLVYLVQYGVRGNAGSLMGPIVLIAAAAAVGGLMLPVIRLLVTRVRGAALSRREHRRSLHAQAGAERRARALMSELCPYGWRAHITLLEGEAVLVSGEAVEAPVALDWYELRPGGGEPAIMRRVWAHSVSEALEAMVADRRTDEALEQIELRAWADGVSWPEP